MERKGGGGANGRKAGWGSGEEGHSEGVAGLKEALQFSVAEDRYLGALG